MGLAKLSVLLFIFSTTISFSYNTGAAAEEDANFAAPDCISWSQEQKNDGLIDAASNGDAETVIKLLDAKADIEAKNKSGSTALIIASRSNHKSTVGSLLKRGANVNAKNKYGNSPLIFAADNLHVDIVEELMSSNANVSVTNDQGYSPVKVAQFRGDTKIADMLLGR